MSGVSNDCIAAAARLRDELKRFLAVLDAATTETDGGRMVVGYAAANSLSKAGVSAAYAVDDASSALLNDYSRSIEPTGREQHKEAFYRLTIRVIGDMPEEDRSRVTSAAEKKLSHIVKLIKEAPADALPPNSVASDLRLKAVEHRAVVLPVEFNPELLAAIDRLMGVFPRKARPGEPNDPALYQFCQALLALEAGDQPIAQTEGWSNGEIITNAAIQSIKSAMGMLSLALPAPIEPELMTEPLTKGEIATLFSVGRNGSVDDILKTYPHDQIAKKFRMRVSDMPPKYHQKRAARMH